MAEKLAEKESEMRLLQERLVNLMKHNDMLAGDKQTLSEQKELFEVGGNIIIHVPSGFGILLRRLLLLVFITVRKHPAIRCN